MTPAVTNRVLSFLLGAALAVAGAVGVLDGAAVAVGRSPVIIDTDRWYTELSSTRLDDGTVQVACPGLILAGLALLVLQLSRRSAAAVPVDPPDQALAERDTSWSVGRDSAEHYLAGKVHGDVRLREHRRGWRAQVSVDTEHIDPAEIEQRTAEGLASLMVAYPDIRVRDSGRRSHGGRRR